MAPKVIDNKLILFVPWTIKTITKLTKLNKKTGNIKQFPARTNGIIFQKCPKSLFDYLEIQKNLK